MAGTVNAKTNPSTEPKIPFDHPDEKKHRRGEKDSHSQKKSTNGQKRSNSRKQSTSTKTKRKKPAKWNCLACGTRNFKKSNTCKSCGGTLPTIALFKASRRAIKFGNPIRLSWEVENADKVIINPGNELVENSGVLDVNPLETTEYVLTAYNGVGEKSLSNKVTLAPPKIDQFKAAEKGITIGFPTILHWKTVNAESLELNMDIGDVSGKAFTEAYLLRPGTCTLVAKNRSGEVRRSIELSLNPPEILSFTALTKTIKLGKPNLLMWELHNTEYVEIYPDIGKVEDNKVEVFPTETTVYTLKAINYSGVVERKFELVLPPPEIVHFAGDNELSTEGAPVELSWEVENANEVYIDQDIGEVGVVGKHKVKPEAAFTTYTLYAKGPSGEAMKSFQITRFPIPLDQQIVENQEEIDTRTDIRNNDLPMHLNEFDELEKQLRDNLKSRSRNLHIQRVQDMDLTEDLLSLEKANLREEVMGIFKKLFKKINKKSNT